MTRKKRPFPNLSESNEFMRSFGEAVGKLVREEQKKYVSPQNIQAFSHGLEWQSHNSTSPDEVSSLKEFQHEFVVESDDVIARRIDLTAKKVNELARAMCTSFSSEMFATISAACDNNGNTISSQGKGFADTFLELIKQVEFGVDREGKPVLPSLHLGTEAFEKFRKDPLFQDPDFELKVEEVTAQKIQAAMERERERLSKFKSRDE